ncbi:MAG TPA: P-loop NTPase [Intrasporangium sp.]|uniref:P-loop NTPase n=1 Tax=Intrasporangium sp. TaxID=1925024 RepID=UPI002B46242D|nr:P-loop NTPase [Intrasporangium sp.]HKX67458.1 P-loop NTPase [Intrasporangium sp.]
MGHVIAVMPASGGVGATTIAAVVAVRAAEAGRSVVAVDLDRFGGRLDVVLGVEQEPGWRWDHLLDVAGVVDGVGLARELPIAGTVPVLSASVGSRRAFGEEWVRILPDVVAGLAAAHPVTVLDVARDERVVSAVAGLVDAWVVVVGTAVPQLAAAAASVPLLRQAVDEAPAESGSGSVDGSAARGGLRPRCEPWIVLRGSRIEDDVADAVTDHLDAPIVATVGDDLRLVSDATSGVAPGSRGRGPVVDAADELLLRLVSRPPLDLGDGGAPSDVGRRWSA